MLELTNAAVSTSGSSEQHVDIDGRRYSHIIDPSSGMGLVDDITVTVIARHGLDADGLDTAVSVLGAERGLALIESRPGAAALIIQRTSRRHDGPAVLTVSGTVGALQGSRLRLKLDLRACSRRFCLSPEPSNGCSAPAAPS